MHEHSAMTVSGRITHIFGHRFVVQTSQGPILADITPKGLEQVELHVGDNVELLGEQKPSELKVIRFTGAGRTIHVEHKKKHHEHYGDADPTDALRAVKAAGFATRGAPRRKPKHYEVLGERDARFTELHVELDGRIRKTKPVDRHDPKWADAINA